MKPRNGLKLKTPPHNKKHDDVCWVIGVVNSYGTVESKILTLNDPDLTDTHATFWPNTLKRWRWSPGDGFVDVAGREPDEFDMGEMDMIRRHLEELGFQV